MERNTHSKSEQEYVKALIQGLSLQRLTDQEIVDYLRNEKQIQIGRSTVTIIKNNIQKQAEKWYIELRQSRYKYIATYKQRLDSLLSYQKKLHDTIFDTKKDEVKIRAISELHSIEMDLFNLWKQLPDLDIGEDTLQEHQRSCEVPPIDDGTEPWTWTIDYKSKPKPNPYEEKTIIAAPIVSAAHELTEKQEDKDGGKILKTR
jgi:hypothetical protein